MKVVALAGGVGGAKMIDGLRHHLGPRELTTIVNTGDDFDHWGLRICPDLDTVCYTVAGLANHETGWGRKDESWNVLSEISRLKGEEWFKIGDRDLATHIVRTERIALGKPLSEIVQDFCKSWGIEHPILPMSNDPVATIVDTIEQGELAFQEYFVHQRCEPTVKGFRFAGIEFARPTQGVLESITEADAVIFCPSNPWVSIDPILFVPGILRAVKEKSVVACISPIIRGSAIKGPAAKMFKELGIVPSPLAVAQHYQSTISHFIFDFEDKEFESPIIQLGLKSHMAKTIMLAPEDRIVFALDVLNFIWNSQ